MAPLDMTCGLHLGRKRTTTAAARHGPQAPHRHPGTARRDVAKRTAPSTRLVAMPATIEARTPSAGTSTKPVSAAPTIAPSVLRAYSRPVSAPARAAVLAQAATAQGKVATIRSAGPSKARPLTII